MMADINENGYGFTKMLVSLRIYKHINIAVVIGFVTSH